MAEEIGLNFDVLNLLWEEIEDSGEPQYADIDGVRSVMFEQNLYIDPCSPALKPHREDRTWLGHFILVAEIAAWQHEINRVMTEYSKLCARQREVKPAKRAMPTLVRTPKPGTVYLISGEHGKHKIGRTSQLPQRLSALRSASGLQLEVITKFEVRDAWQTESFLHQKFHQQRGVGEWFDLSENDVNWFLSLDSAALENMITREAML